MIKIRGRQKGQAGKQGAAPVPSTAQLREIFTTCEQSGFHASRNKAIIATFFFMGLRPMECASLKLEDVYDFERDCFKEVVFLKKEYTKRSKPRYVPATHPVLRQHWHEYFSRDRQSRRFRPDQALFLSQKGSHFTPNSIGNLMNRIIEKQYGLHRGSSYCGRRYFATDLHEKGNSVRLICELMGHSNEKITHRYIVTSMEQKIRAVNSLY